MKYLIVITGPTAIGKTGVAVKTARHFNTEIVSADSRQIYKELVIGTAVPRPEQLAAVRHHFIHSHSIFDNYNASRYETEAMEVIERLFLNVDTVVLTGGSMLYLDAVCKGIDFVPDVDPDLRKHLKLEHVEKGLSHLRLKLKALDPDYYKQVDLKNHARIIHALEVCLMTGMPYSSFRKAKPKNRNFRMIKIALDCDRAELHKRINQRVDDMIMEGLEQEALNNFEFRQLNSLNTVGYKELFECIEGNISRDKAIELIKRNTRRYARKQLTWFRTDQEYQWYCPEDLEGIIRYIESSVSEK